VGLYIVNLVALDEVHQTFTCTDSASVSRLVRFSVLADGRYFSAVAATWLERISAIRGARTMR